MSLSEIYEEWEELKKKGKFGKEETDRIKSTKEEIKKINSINPEEAKRLVKQLIDEMEMQIRNASSGIAVEKIIYPSSSNDEEAEKEKIINRIYTEDKDDNKD